MPPPHQPQRSIPRSRVDGYLTILKMGSLILALALAKLTYDAVIEHPSSKSNFLTLVSTLKRPQLLPVLLALLLIPFTPVLRNHLKWAFIPCLIAGIFLNLSQWRDLTIFHPSHRIRIPASATISAILKSEEDAYLKQCVAPFLELRRHLQGATLLLPKDTVLDLDNFRLFSVALVDKVERVSFDPEISEKELDTFASRPGAQYFQYTGLSDRERRYIFVGPVPSKVYRVYTSDRNLVLAEEGYAVKQSD